MHYWEGNILFQNQRIKKPLIKRINIYFGGNDKKNLTGKILEILIQDEFKDIYIDVVLGLQHEHIRNSRSCKKRKILLYMSHKVV